MLILDDSNAESFDCHEHAIIQDLNEILTELEVEFKQKAVSTWKIAPKEAGAQNKVTRNQCRLP